MDKSEIKQYLEQFKNKPFPEIPVQLSKGLVKDDSERLNDQNYLESINYRDLISEFKAYINSEETFKALRQLSELVEDDEEKEYAIPLLERIKNLSREDRKIYEEVQRLSNNIIFDYLKVKPKYPLTIEKKIEENGETKITKQILNDLEVENYSLLEPKYTGIEEVLELFMDNSLKGANLILKREEKHKEIKEKERNIKKVGIFQGIVAGAGIIAYTLNLIDHETHNLLQNFAIYSAIGLEAYSQYLIKRPINKEIEKLRGDEEGLVERIEDYNLARDRKTMKSKLGMGDILGFEE